MKRHHLERALELAAEHTRVRRFIEMGSGPDSYIKVEATAGSIIYPEDHHIDVSVCPALKEVILSAATVRLAEIKKKLADLGVEF